MSAYPLLNILDGGKGIETIKVFANNVSATDQVEGATGKFTKLTGTSATFTDVVATSLTVTNFKATSGETELSFDKLITGPSAEFTSTLTLPGNEDISLANIVQNGLYFRGDDGETIIRIIAENPGVGDARGTLSIQGLNQNKDVWEVMGNFV